MTIPTTWALSIIRDGVLIKYRAYQDSVIIPDVVTRIGEKAFKRHKEITGVIIPESVTSIEQNAFEKCTGLTSITIPDNVTSIGEKAFCDCKGLTGVTIPDNVEEIGKYAFGYWCDDDTAYVTDGFTIFGKRGTEAERYAKENGIAFEEVGKG